MVHDRSQDVTATADGQKTPRQAVAGLMPPELAETMIREAWPTLLGIQSGVAGLAATLIRTVFLAPLGWLLLGPLFLVKFMPVFCRRYTLTSRNLMVRRGWKPSPVHTVALRDIDDVTVEPDSYNSFYRCGNLDVLSKGQVVLKLVGVPEPESFRHAVVNAVKAWGGPDKLKGPFLPASAPVKS